MLQRSDSKFSQGETNLKITCSGFEPKNKKAYEQYIVKLGGTYSDAITIDTNIMIAKNVISEKYRGGCVMNIPIVTSDWLVDSFKNKGFLPTEKYRLPFFKGLTIGILGFPSDEIEEIKKIINDNMGEEITSLVKIQEGQEMNLVIVKTSELKRYESFIFSLPIPVVSVDWLKLCMLNKQFIKPSTYSLNIQKNTTRQSASQRTNETLNTLQHVEGHLNKALNDFDISDERWCYLEKAVIYLHNIEGKLENILKKLIDAGGGFYIDEIISDVTHIVTEEYYDTEIKNFNTFKEVKVVSPLWLKDCLIYRRMAKEEDYILLPIPLPEPTLASQNSTSMNSLSRRNTLNMTQGSNDDMGRVMKRLPSIQETKREHKEGHRGKSLGVSHSDSLKSDKDKYDRKKKSGDDKHDANQSKSKKKPVNIVGYVFKNINIYIDPTMKNFSHYKKLVEENSGRVLDHRNVFEEIFHILPDSADSVAQMRKKGKNERCVSYRWIDYCIKNKMIIKDIEQKKLVHLAPFSVQLPITEFKEKVIYFAGFPTYDKAIWKEVVELLGAKFAYDGNLSVLVCQDVNSKKVQEIRGNNPNIPIVSDSWIFECVQKGRFINPNSYIIPFN